ncbi:MAG: thioredoxin family protein [Candidatus Micrarchaeia archaeon]|jgi:glutaredoxin
MDLVENAKGFLSTPFNRYLVLALVLLGLFVIAMGQNPTPLQPDGGPDGNLTIHFFYLESCPHCAEQKPFNQELMAEYPSVKWAYHDAAKAEEYQLMAEIGAKHGISPYSLGVPMTVIGDKLIIGFLNREVSGPELRQAVADYAAGAEVNGTVAGGGTTSDVHEFDLPFLGRTDLTELSLPVLAVVLGLVDGFNPCAMWVLVYLIALVMEMNDRRRIWFIVGSFVLASGILYFLFMTAWLNAFLLLGYIKGITVAIGLVALGGGVLMIKEFVETKGAMNCKVEGAEDKKKTMSKIQELVTAPMTIVTLVGIVALAFAVNSVEFVCSAAIPAVFTQVLAVSDASTLEHYGYILLYDVAFMLDDLIIFSLAAFAVSGGVGQKYMKYCKIIGGLIMLFLGWMLLFAPNLLR